MLQVELEKQEAKEAEEKEATAESYRRVLEDHPHP